MEETGFPSGSVGKNTPAMQEPQEMQVQSLGQDDPLEEAMATRSSILPWRIPWTEEPGGLPSVVFAMRCLFFQAIDLLNGDSTLD